MLLKMKVIRCDINQGNVLCSIIHLASNSFLLLSLNVTTASTPQNKSTGEAAVATAVTEIKMSATHSCRVNNLRHKQPPQQASADRVA